MSLKEDLLWLAGLTDGEGSFCVSIGPDKCSGLGIRPRFVIGIKVDNSGWVDKVQKVLKGYGIPHSLQIKRKHSSRWSDIHRIFIYKQDAIERFAKLLLPYLTIKKKQAKLFSLLPRGRRTLHGRHQIPSLDWKKVEEFIKFTEKSRQLNCRPELAKWTPERIRQFYSSWEHQYVKI